MSSLSIDELIFVVPPRLRMINATLSVCERYVHDTVHHSLTSRW